MPLIGTEMFTRLLQTRHPDAVADILGNPEYEDIRGQVDFYDAGRGTLIVAEVFNLPKTGADGKELTGIHGFHIHEGSSCTGTPEQPFADTGGHYDTDSRLHPLHTGDMPPLFASDGYAYLIFYTTKFRPFDLLGKTVIIHQNQDDLTTNPSGNSGEKIACGVIKQNLRI
ncbi:MAG: superoxide dismutase family protein [Bacillota bacterium]|nr:superoxide dismutase family protein [Bacillota bacterium]